jgi:hypothetical protein
LSRFGRPFPQVAQHCLLWVVTRIGEDATRTTIHTAADELGLVGGLAETGIAKVAVSDSFRVPMLVGMNGVKGVDIEIMNPSSPIHEVRSCALAEGDT